MQNPWWTRRVHVEPIFLLTFALGEFIIGLAVGLTILGNYFLATGLFVFGFLIATESLNQAWTDCASGVGSDSPVPMWLRPWWKRNIADDFPYEDEEM